MKVTPVLFQGQLRSLQCAECEDQEVSSIKMRKLSTATKRPCCIINVLLSLSRLQSPLGRSLMPNAAATPSSTQLCSAEFSIWYPSRNLFSLLENKFSPVKGTHWCAVHLFALFIPLWRCHINLTYACDIRLSVCRILFRHPKGSFSIPMKAESNQSAFYQQHQMLLRVFFKLRALIASLGLISWSVSICEQQTVFMFAVT